MLLLLVALSVLFAASLVIFAYFRVIETENWDHIPWPRTIWIATALLVTSSATIHVAVSGARHQKPAMLLFGLISTTALGVAFLLLQWHSWSELQPFFEHAQQNATRRAADAVRNTQFTAPPRIVPKAFAMFYVLTGLHGAHVIGGVLPLIWSTVRGLLGHYSRGNYEGVWRVAVYWHFLDVVWLILLATLLAGG